MIPPLDPFWSHPDPALKKTFEEAGGMLGERFAFCQAITGLSPKRLRESLRRLEAARLLTWSESAIGFPASPEVVPLPDRADFRRFLDAIPNHQRLAPVPRRILRLLAGGARPALIATILGHLVRCLYLKHGKCSARGRVKASWIADTFGVSLRRVKQARKELIAMGWLIPLEARQWALNRWGSHVCINLAWSRLDGIKPDIRLAATAPAAADGLPPAPAPGRELAPPPLPPGAESAPPDSNKEPLQGAKNQEPAAGGPAGFFISQPEEQTPEHGQTQPDDEAPIPQAASPLLVAISATSENPAPSVAPGPRSSSAPRAKCPPPGKPDLRNVVPEDLKDTGRLLELYGQAVGFGLVTASECDRLRFVAAAEHARIIGTRNPCGLFVRLVRGGLWHFATHDATRRRPACGSGGTFTGSSLSGGWSANRGSGRGGSCRTMPAWCRRCARWRPARGIGAIPSHS